MPTLFMIKIGAKPAGRLIEQHDMFFGVANEVQELIPAVDKHWSEVAGKWHFDAYRPVTVVNNHRIEWVDEPAKTDDNSLKLFFINLGGYLADEFEEFHHKLLIVAKTEEDAIAQAKQSDFYKGYSAKKEGSVALAVSHIDDKMAVDVDDVYDVNGLIARGSLHITPITTTDGQNVADDESVIGYIPLKHFE